MSASRTLGRRLFARATMGMPLVLKSGGNYPTPPVAPPAGLAGLIGAESSGMNVAKQSLISNIWRAIRAETKDEQRVHSLRWERRSMMGGLDPDLAVLNSMSHVRRVQIQMDREKAHRDKMQSLSARIIRAMGGNPEDFE